jgi:hypothetical protein
LTHDFEDKRPLVAKRDLPRKAVKAAVQPRDPRDGAQVKGAAPKRWSLEGSL